MTQCWPGAHAGPDPHTQLPVAAQVSAVTGSHVAHAEPAVPQVDSVRATHALPMQQPFGHDTSSQTHVPAAQCWPGAQTAPPPHWQAPAVEQVSARTPSQATQAAPFGPQVAAERGLQTEPVQQPVAQLATQPLHAPLVQVSAPGHVWHAEPAAPHAAVDVPS